MKKTVLVSACLLGISCRYDGKSKPDVRVIELNEKYNLVPVCPEIYGGLPTPRTPSERVGERTVMKDGTDVTENYLGGAEVALSLYRTLGCSAALLKAKSPSCGVAEIYDGSFTGTLTERDGVTAELLIKEGIAVFNENQLVEMEKYLDKV